jgi:hypothetical protein
MDKYLVSWDQPSNHHPGYFPRSDIHLFVKNWAGFGTLEHAFQDVKAGQK